MDRYNITKKYTNEQITVVWQSGKCTHSGNCVRFCSEVFHPANLPWITMESASTEKIIETVNTCPSGALTYYKNK